jgi:hypothetical protein
MTMDEEREIEVRDGEKITISRKKICMSRIHTNAQIKKKCFNHRKTW